MNRKLWVSSIKLGNKLEANRQTLNRVNVFYLEEFDDFGEPKTYLVETKDKDENEIPGNDYIQV